MPNRTWLHYYLRGYRSWTTIYLKPQLRAGDRRSWMGRRLAGSRLCIERRFHPVHLPYCRAVLPQRSNGDFGRNNAMLVGSFEHLPSEEEKGQCPMPVSDAVSASNGTSIRESWQGKENSHVSFGPSMETLDFDSI